MVDNVIFIAVNQNNWRQNILILYGRNGKAGLPWDSGWLIYTLAETIHLGRSDYLDILK
jgi:hypothetical protein